MVSGWMEKDDLRKAVRDGVKAMDWLVEAQVALMDSQGEMLSTVAVNLKQMLELDNFNDIAKTKALIQTLYEYVNGDVEPGGIVVRHRELESRILVFNQ